MFYPQVYTKAEELNQFNEVFVQITQSSPEKSYILQKRFPFRHETTKIIHEKKKKEKRAAKNKRRKVGIPEEGNKILQRKIKRSMKRSKKNQTIEMDLRCSKYWEQKSIMW